VPTRRAYVVGVVDPSERTAAAAYTNTARYLTRPVAPLLAGAVIRGALGAPFVIAGALKSVYDVGFYVLFRDVEVEGEQRGVPATADQRSCDSTSSPRVRRRNGPPRVPGELEDDHRDRKTSDRVTE
jgi:hypothetical protein